MPKLLRDEIIANISVTEDSLSSINDLLINRKALINQQFQNPQENNQDLLLLTYIIRFDGRGYTLYDFEEVLNLYNQATKVERVIFTLDTARSERTNRIYGSHYEIRFDLNDPNNSYITCASDDGDSVDAVFNGLKEILQKGKNKNFLVRNTWTQLLVQILGVIFGFIISLIASIKISPNLNIDNAFVLTFIFAFLIYSNTWGFINQQFLRLLDYSFPNIRFHRAGKVGIHWLIQTIVGGIVAAFVLFLFGNLMDWFGIYIAQVIN